MWRRCRRVGWATIGVQLKFQREISVAREFPLKSVVSKPQAGLPSLQYQSWKVTQITSCFEK